MKRKAWILAFLAGASCFLLLLWVRNTGEVPAARAHFKSPEQPAGTPRPRSTLTGQVENARLSEMPQGLNAADILKNAFVLYDSLTEEEKSILNHPKEEIDEAKAEAIFKKIQPILALIRQAAHADYCDWCTGSLKFDQPIPQLTKTASLAKLSLWAAGYQFPNDPGAALEELADHAKLGRAIGGSNGMIGLLLESSLERSATQLMVVNAGQITPELASKYQALLSTSSLPLDLKSAMNAELEGFSDAMTKLSSTGEEAPESIDSPEANAKAYQANQTQIKRMEEEFGKMALASDADFQRWKAGFKASPQDTESVITTFLDLVTSNRNQLRQAAIEKSMLAAGLAVLHNGSAQLGSFPEPGTQVPFIYHPTADGFELQSQALFKGKPILMRFSPPL